MIKTGKFIVFLAFCQGIGYCIAWLLAKVDFLPKEKIEIFLILFLVLYLAVYLVDRFYFSPKEKKREIQEIDDFSLLHSLAHKKEEK